ncbi:hypothetical protein CDAR_40501 [Caerostris darwini]|uniref:Secreted protein n=1 Tax=Caerostris darwini TaxID=1538125 RepID=A0AAV4R8E6_9ARAC|nr:hypothetical protein CDAR_40501 [Caerostris darwini]
MESRCSWVLLFLFSYICHYRKLKRNIPSRPILTAFFTCDTSPSTKAWMDFLGHPYPLRIYEKRSQVPRRSEEVNPREDGELTAMCRFLALYR